MPLRRPNLSDGPSTLGTIFANVANAVSGAADLAPEDTFDYQPPTQEDLVRRTPYKGVRSGRSKFAVLIVDPDAAGASYPPAICGVLKENER